MIPDGHGYHSHPAPTTNKWTVTQSRWHFVAQENTYVARACNAVLIVAALALVEIGVVTAFRNASWNVEPAPE